MIGPTDFFYCQFDPVGNSSRLLIGAMGDTHQSKQQTSCQSQSAVKAFTGVKCFELLTGHEYFHAEREYHAAKKRLF